MACQQESVGYLLWLWRNMCGGWIGQVERSRCVIAATAKTLQWNRLNCSSLGWLNGGEEMSAEKIHKMQVLLEWYHVLVYLQSLWYKTCISALTILSGSDRVGVSVGITFVVGSILTWGAILKKMLWPRVIWGTDTVQWLSIVFIPTDPKSWSGQIYEGIWVTHLPVDF